MKTTPLAEITRLINSIAPADRATSAKRVGLVLHHEEQPERPQAMAPAPGQGRCVDDGPMHAKTRPHSAASIRQPRHTHARIHNYPADITCDAGLVAGA